MKFTFLGSGSAFTMKNYQSNMLLTINGKNLLVDCGNDARWALGDLGMSYKNVDAVYISHLHADHVGGLEWLAFTKYFDKSQPKLPMYISAMLVDELWNGVLRGGLCSIQNKMMTLYDFFDVRPIKDNGTFVFEGTEMRTVQTVHIMNGYCIVPSYGLIWTAPNKQRIFLTTDTQFCPNQITDFYNDADIIFHDCETSSFKSGVHANYEDMKTLPKETKAKMWLYHYQDNPPMDSKKDGFLGFVKPGELFDFSVPLGGSVSKSSFCMEEALASIPQKG